MRKRAQGIIEYAILATAIVAVVVIVAGLMGGSVSGVANKFLNVISGT